jgi:DNA-binding beta-propeller fold protein YncE
MSKPTILRRTLRLIPLLAIAGSGLAAAQAAPPFLPKLINSSTVPANGDQNPYRVAFVPQGFPSDGRLKAGDVLVSNFNNNANAGNIQGTGTTIIRLHPNGRAAPPGTAETFFTSELPGLSTALGVARGGFVFVGNVPTTDGTFATIGQGALQVIDRNGHWVRTWTDATFLDGPWDLALDDDGGLVHLFVSNVLNGTVARLDVLITDSSVKLVHRTLIAKGYPHVPNAAAVVLGPTGLAFDASTGNLYVASTADNTIYAIADASYAQAPVERGVVVFSDPHLRGPLGLRLAPNGHLLTSNGDATTNADAAFPSEMIEFSKAGEFVRQFNVDASQGGAFGFDTRLEPEAPYNFAWVDDVTNTVTLADLTAP